MESSKKVRSKKKRRSRTKLTNPYERRLVKLIRNPLQLISLPLILAYYELLLMIIRGNNISLFFPVFFAVSSGLIITTLLTFLPRRFYIWIKGIIIGVIAVIFITECLIKNSFQQYMPYNVILHGAGGIMKHYSSQLFAAIFSGLLLIILYLIPTVLYVLCYRRWRLKVTQQPIRKIICIAAGLVLYLLTWIFAITGKSGSIYKESYSFNTATQKFGLLTTIRLDTKYALFGNKYQSDFVFDTDSAVEKPVTPVPTPTPAAETPSETQEAAPETQETAPEPTTGTPVAYDELNIMNIDFDALMASTGDETVQQMHQYVNSLAPGHKNNYTGAFAGKNLIMITAEALSDCAVDPNLTPTLYRMANNGFRFKDFYQPSWGGSTSTGEFSFVTGLIPLDGEETILETQHNNLYFTPGNALQRQNYFSRAFHNGDQEYYSRYLTHQNLGYSEFIASFQGLEDLTGVTYPTDTMMFDATMDTYMGNAPFSVYYMTLSGHSNYVQNGLTDKYIDIVNQFYGDRYQETTKYYLCYQMELDRALELMINKLEAAGLADSTVIALVPDHYPYGLEQSATFGNDQDYLADLYGYVYTNWKELDHSVGIIWSKCMEKDPSEEGYVAPVTISSPTYSIDMVPTILNLFGLEFDSRLLPGRDVLDPTTEAMVVWGNHSWLTDAIYHDSSSGNDYLTDGSGQLAGPEWTEYINQKHNQALNKIMYSERVVNTNYYGVLFGEDTNF
ncbi:MAG: LTA synthase family protein [Lachnospiraceae bacterium]|nr:LTA synthase family protein [Lachnospiraceae bacterium]